MSAASECDSKDSKPPESCLPAEDGDSGRTSDLMAEVPNVEGPQTSAQAQLYEKIALLQERADAQEEKANDLSRTNHIELQRHADELRQVRSELTAELHQARHKAQISLDQYRAQVIEERSKTRALEAQLHDERLQAQAAAAKLEALSKPKPIVAPASTTTQ